LRSRPADSTLSGMPFEMVLEFDSNSTEFTRGVEAGTVWTLLRFGCPEALPGLYHESNARMLQRIAHATGHVAWISRSSTPGWIQVEFSREPRQH
jgi:hypothetical protein